MPTEGAVFLATVVGCLAFAGGIGLALVVWAIVSWWRSDREPDDEPEDIDEAAQEAEERIAAVHRKAHEMLATSVLRGTGEHAHFDGLMRETVEDDRRRADP
jgi:hypothetical protein